MDKIIAKIDEIYASITGAKVLEALNALLKYVGDALKGVLGEDEAGDIVLGIWGFGDK